jgi:ketosteroid isomerase-like protein
MKTIAALCVLFLLVSPVRSACQGTTAMAEIRKLEEQERIAVTNGDTAALFALWSADYVVNNPNNMILTAAQIKKFVRGTGMDKTSFTRNIEKISFIKDVAVVMGSETLTPKDKNGNAGKPVYRRYTNIWIKNDNGWMLSARQATSTLIQ